MSSDQPLEGNNSSETTSTPASTSTASEMAVSAKSIPLTLIVATTPKLGIGLNGSLPWPALRAEMAYFARVTKRVVPKETAQSQQSASTGTSSQASTPSQLNAVIMGRKTYESIPTKFRPLKDRVNIVLTRSAGQTASTTSSTESTPEGPFYLSSLSSALDFLSDKSRARTTGRVFVIGGAEVYAQAAKMQNCKRVLRTRIEKEYECDVWFPLDLEADQRWKRSTHQELEEWIGESVSENMQQDGSDGTSVKWRYEMWEQRNEHRQEDGTSRLNELPT